MLRIPCGAPNIVLLYTDYLVQIHSELFNGFTELQLSMEDLVDAMSKIDKRKDAGPHLLTADFFLYNNDILAPHILSLLNSILTNATFPPNFKSSYIIPIPKKGKAIEITNYRGIAIQSISQNFR